MDKESSEIILNFINFLRSKKEVIQQYEEKYSKVGKEEVPVKRYEWEDIISESYDIINQSIQAVRSLQMENENLKEAILSIQTLQQSSQMKQSVFSFEGKQPAGDYDIEENIALRENYVERNKGENYQERIFSTLEITRENDLLIKNNYALDKHHKELLEEEEILPHTPYQPFKNDVRNNINDHHNKNDGLMNKYERSKDDILTEYQPNTYYLQGSPGFSRKSESKQSPSKQELQENILIMDSYNRKKKDTNPNDYRNENNIYSEGQHFNEEIHKNISNSSNFNTITNPINSNNKSPFKVGIRQKLRGIANNNNSRSQTLNLSNIYSNNDREVEITSANKAYAVQSNSISMRKDDKEALLGEILKKFAVKENFKNYFAMKYADGSFLDLQNKLFSNDAFLYDVGRELYEIESQINTYQEFPEESKFSQPIVQNTNATSHSMKTSMTRRSFQKKEELSKTQTSQAFTSINKSQVRANSNRHSNDQSKEKKVNNNESYFDPVNFEKMLRNDVKATKTTAASIKKPFNRFANASSDKRRNLNKSGDLLNRSKSREFIDTNMKPHQQSINI